jgi:hypothetical protein
VAGERGARHRASHEREGEKRAGHTSLMGKDAACRLNKVCYYKMGYAAQ